MKKCFVYLIILVLICIPNIALAGDNEEGTIYDASLDTEEIIEIRYAGDSGSYLYETASMYASSVGFVENNTVIYIKDFIEVNEENSSIMWILAKTNQSENFYYIRFNETAPTSDVDSGYNSVDIKVSDNVDSNTPNSNQYKITYYCSACNSPSGNIVALAGSHAFVGSCAANDFPLGVTIHVEGYGNYFVNDRVGKNGVIDIYMGDYEGCSCSGTGFANAYIIG